MITACLQVQHGALAIFGPSDQHLGAHVQSICDALEIPHLEVCILVIRDHLKYRLYIFKLIALRLDSIWTPSISPIRSTSTHPST